MAFTAPTKINPIEEYFTWWCNELKETGFIKEYRREPFSIELTPKIEGERVSFKKKTSVENESYIILNRKTYRFDYIIVWEPKAREYFYNLIDEPYRLWCPMYAQVDKEGLHVSLVDVKTTAVGSKFGNNTTAYTFPIIQSLLFHFYNLYVNKAIPIPTVSQGQIKSGNASSLFTTTFVPKRYILTDGGGQARDIKYRFLSLQQYIQKRNHEVAQANARTNVQQKLL